MSVPTRRRAAGTVEPSTILLWAALILVLTSAGLVTAALHLANAVAARPQRLPGNPAQLAVGLAHRTVVWTPAATVFTAVLAGAALAAAVVTVALVVRAGRRRPRVDRALSTWAAAATSTPWTRRRRRPPPSGWG